LTIYASGGTSALDKDPSYNWLWAWPHHATWDAECWIWLLFLTCLLYHTRLLCTCSTV